MQSALKSFAGKVTYSLGANLLSLIVSVLTVLLIPRFFGSDVNQYGFFQVFVFYSSYIGLLHFGWCDGILLRDGGKYYKDLNKPLYSSQFWLLLATELAIALIIGGAGFALCESEDYLFICILVAINIVVVIPKTMLSYYLQTTSRIKEYSFLTASGRVFFGMAIIIIVVVGIRDYRFFVYGETLGQMLSLAVGLWYCKDIVCTRPSAISIGILQAKENIHVGFSLLVANIAGMLITGIVQFGIQTQWDVATFGKISFTLSISNLLLVFMSAIAVVLYPTLRRITQEKLATLYTTARCALMVPLMCGLLLYYPLVLVLSLWLPNYLDALQYMAILFPLCVYMAKMNLLVMTYMKVCRMERTIMKVGILGVLFAIVLTIAFVFILKSLTAAMVSIVLNQLFRCVYSEIELSRAMKVSVMKDIVLEMILTILFISASWFIGGWMGFALYAIGYIGYLYVKKGELKAIISMLKEVHPN